MPVSPYPILDVHATSGLTFPWTEMHPDGKVGSFDWVLGPDGVTLAMVIWIYWDDLADALQQILGYSYRDNSGPTPRMRRYLPWQHPYSNQLWVKNISSVKGIQLEGKTVDLLQHAAAGPGAFYNAGPWSSFRFAQLTLHFWRPPYFIRSDEDVEDAAGKPLEWLRYFDKHWQGQTQMLSRETGTFKWVGSQGLPSSAANFQGHVGQPICKLRIKRKWYQIPEQCIFGVHSDVTPNGLPLNLLYTRTATTNPITGYVYPAARPIVGTVNSPYGGGTTDTVEANRFLGFYIGTLMYENYTITPTPLQLPASLMQIPYFASMEPISQVQYDIEFDFVWFDPPRTTANETANPNYSGHNLMPWSGNGMWYAVSSQMGVDNPLLPASVANPGSTPLQYADLTDLFTSM